MRHILTFVFSMFVIVAFSQNYTISGKIKDASNGEDLIGAAIIVEGGGGAITNEYGFYSLTLPKASYKLTYRYLGYESVSKQVTLTSNTTINLQLQPESKAIGEVVISAKAAESKVENKKISVVKMETAKIKEIPVIFGEVDILKTITLMPGVQSAGEGNSGFNVRGGSQDQNLILLDEATVYNASHLLGFFSVFNGDAVKDLELYKGGIPAKYGGRLASIVDIKMRDGNNKKFAAIGGIGTISSRLTVEGPLQKDKASFMVAGRRSYADLFLPFAPDESIRESKLYFYDLNLKANYEISDKDRIYVSAYFGRDVLGLSSLFGLSWGNGTATLRWNHLVNSKLFVNTSFVYSDFNYDVNIKFAENAAFNINQNIRDAYVKSDWTYFNSAKSKINFGGQLINHAFNPGIFSPSNKESEKLFSRQALNKNYGLESGLYVDHEYTHSPKLNVRYGLRLSTYSNLGGYFYNYTKNNVYNPIDSLTKIDTFSKNEIHNTFAGLEPRLAISYNLNEQTALKVSYNRTYQYLQQATNTASSFPTDQWFSVNNNILPQKADQVSAGLFKNLPLGIETSAEVYYKWMDNQIDYRDNAQLTFNQFLDGEVLSGRGWAYGAEFYVAKNGGKNNGFISYTLAKSMRQIDGINNNNPYAANFDRRHNLSVVYTHKFTPRLLATAAFVLSSGQPLTVPASRYYYQGKWLADYSAPRNEYRLPTYHRADVSVILKNKEKPGKRLRSSWNFSIYNLYNRENPYAIYFREVVANDRKKTPEAVIGNTAAVQTTLFKIIPAVTWNFEF